MMSSLCSRLARRVGRVQRRRPAKTELGGVAQHVVTRRRHSTLHPRNEIVERLLAYDAVEAAMSRPAHGPLHQEVPGAGGLGAAAIVLLKAEGNAEVGGLVERHHRSANLARQL